MTNTTFYIIVMNVMNGMILGLGYGSLIEMFSDIGPVFFLAFLAHVIISTWYTTRGFMYEDVSRLCRLQKELLEDMDQ